jgi:hypothetical protein
MKILALDSSGLVAGVAVTEDDNLLGEYTINYKKTHKHKHNIASVSTLTNLQNYTTPLSIFDISKTESYFLHLFLSDEMFFLIKYRIRKRFSSPCEKNISYYLVSNDLTK